MSDSSAPVRIPVQAALDWTAAIFAAAGLSQADAAAVAGNLVTADLRGVASHGIMRVPVYLARIRGGAVAAAGRPAVISRSGATALVDGGNAMGQVAGDYAMDLAIELAREHGVGWVSVRGSNHYGACAYFALRAVAQGMIGATATVGGKNIMAPWGGAEPLLGNNPFGIAIPGDPEPVVLDMAMSVVANGKILMASKTGAPIPEGWAIDADGEPTTDAARALAGLVLPLGAYKGYAMSFMTALLAGTLGGAAAGDTVTDWFADFTSPQNVGHWMLALDVSRFRELGEFAAQVGAIAGLMRGARRAPGVAGVLVPGDPEAAAAAANTAAGIGYDPAVLAELAAEAAALGLPPLAAAGQEGR
jgi:LDH2 family malate/lactate/ureidoglycolate dehydrogenase